METKELFMRLKNGNDVRGAALAAEGEERTLTPGLVTLIARAFSLWLADECGKPADSLKIGVGHDSRVTAEMMKDACIRGLAPSEVFDCGLITTPAMFQSTVLPESGFDGAVMITASHLPFNRNGMKFFTPKGGIEKTDLEVILENAAASADELAVPDEGDFIRVTKLPEGPAAAPFDMVTVYSDQMKKLICESVKADQFDKPLKGLHIVVDAGNGASGFFADRILSALGADISGSVYLEPDGTFPNHIPNPENEKAMQAVRSAVLSAGADLGVIFDCDGDRGAVVLNDGTEVNRNTLIALLSAIIAPEYPGSTVVTDSVTSDELAVFLEDELHLRHLRFKRGYKNVIGKGVELNAKGEECELAIETSGHGAFRGNYFSDDGAYIAVRIICKMAEMRKNGGKLQDLIAKLGQPAESEEHRYKILCPDFRSYGENVLADFLQFAEQDPRFNIVEPNYEGIRISFDDEEVRGWLLIRMSLHDPVMPLNVESSGKGGCAVIMKRIEPFIRTHGFLAES